VEGSVEHGDVRHRRKQPAGIVHRRDCGPVVERRELGERTQLALDRVVDDDRLAEPRSPVDDAMGDGVDIIRGIGDRGDRVARPVFAHDGELQARRARVDDEDTLLCCCLHAGRSLSGGKAVRFATHHSFE